MKRDMDLIRQILLAVEANEHGFAPDNISISGYTQEEIQSHIFLLGEAGLAEVCDTTSSDSDSPSALISRLTWSGHEFLDAARENNIWNQAKDKISKIGGATLPVWTAILTAFLKEKLGLPQ